MGPATAAAATAHVIPAVGGALDSLEEEGHGHEHEHDGGVHGQDGPTNISGTDGRDPRAMPMPAAPLPDADAAHAATGKGMLPSGVEAIGSLERTLAGAGAATVSAAGMVTQGSVAGLLRPASNSQKKFADVLVLPCVACAQMLDTMLTGCQEVPLMYLHSVQSVTKKQASCQQPSSQQAPAYSLHSLT